MLQMWSLARNSSTDRWTKHLVHLEPGGTGIGLVIAVKRTLLAAQLQQYT